MARSVSLRRIGSGGLFVLKIAVCIKQIPLIEEANFDPETRTIRRDGPNLISAFDLRALSLAMELKRRFGAETTVVTMGPPQAEQALRDALAMGMDRAVHLTDRAFAGSDTLATARALAACLKKGGFDLVLLGKYSLDAETGQVGPEIAELLGVAQITGVRKLEIDGRMLRAERESDEGYEEIEAAMPAVLTCAERVAQPIKVKADAAERAKSKTVETVTAKEIGLEPSQLGFAGSPTWVSEIRVVETPKTECRHIDPDDPRRAARELIEHLDRAGALKPRARERRAISSAIRKPVRGCDVWVAVETGLDGAVTRVTLEMLSRGDALATRMGGALVAVGFTGSIARHAELLLSYGTDRIIAIESPEIETYTPEALAEAMAAMVREREPWALLVAASERGRDWGPRLAARLGLGLTGDAIGLEIDAENRMVALKPAFGGNIIAPILSKTHPQMATVRPGMLELAEPNRKRHGEIETVRRAIKRPLSRLLAEYPLLDTSVARLEGAEVVIGVGMGLGGPEGVNAIKELARVLGAGICATRRVTDAGWIPRQHQVGLTGKAIDARLYIAVGVRGAPNHTVGLKRAETVVAINNDPEALIFERADFGLVSDWAYIVPALCDAFRERLG